jgi:hypothetical protein
MRNYLLLAAAGLLSLTTSVRLPAEKPKPDLWILSGQSNACGRAKLPGPEPHPLATMFDADRGEYVVAQDPLPQMGTTGVGPWVAAAQQVAAELNVPIRMCGFASGGKSIAFWHPGQPGHRGGAVYCTCNQGIGGWLCDSF